MTTQPPSKKTKFVPYKGHFRPSKKQYLEVGQRGFLATCNFRERDCVRECYNILNHYADLYGQQETSSEPVKTDAKEASAEEGGEEDIADALQNEIDSTKKKSAGGNGALKERFQVVDTGTTNCVFIRTTLPNPAELGAIIVKDIARSREQKTRFLLRLVPVEAVCRANVADITKAGGIIFDKHFLKEPSTFSIAFNKRYNNSIKRDDVIRELATLVQEKNVGNRVDLKQAAKTVVVEVIKGLCCLAVVEGYLQHKKYNLVELANAKEATAAENEGQEENSEKDLDEAVDKTEETKQPDEEGSVADKEAGKDGVSSADEPSDSITDEANVQQKEQ